ncbi:MAG: Fic family protein [Candidatus Omnitrophica bacterium]|nr:Fic family protein [Candidatus Omnitrophota bacterium]
MNYIWKQSGWPHFRWQSERLINKLSRARFLQGKLLSKVQSLGLDHSEESRSEILIEEAVKTSAIEGQCLDRESVRSSVARKLGLPIPGLKATDKNADGLIDIMLNATDNYKKTLTAKRLKSWQAALFPTGFSGLSKILVGKWRGDRAMQVVSGPVGRQKVHFEAPPAAMVSSEMSNFIKWWEKDSKKLDGLLRAAVAHFYFVTIHPFEDGNGRIARVLTDMALAQDENLSKRYYSLSARIMAEREAYYNILEKCQKGSLNITEWLLWFLECYCRAIDYSEGAISKVLQKAAFWQKHAQTILNKNQRKVINRLLDAGKGGFIGGLSTRKYVSITKVSRATAYRDITDLLKKKILIRHKSKGRSVSYELIFPEI